MVLSIAVALLYRPFLRAIDTYRGRADLVRAVSLVCLYVVLVIRCSYSYDTACTSTRTVEVWVQTDPCYFVGVKLTGTSTCTMYVLLVVVVKFLRIRFSFFQAFIIHYYNSNMYKYKYVRSTKNDVPVRYDV